MPLLPLNGKVSLVTGASRGIGAAAAMKLAVLGSDLAINYRSKSARAEEVCKEVANLGRRAIAVRADLTIGSELDAMMSTVQEVYGLLDVLVLNASGGLENGKPEGYAMTLNHAAQLNTARAAVELVAKSKHAGEQALRDYISGLNRTVSFVVVSGDVIEGTITPRLLERKSPGLIEERRQKAKKLPTIDEFAEAIANAAVDKDLSSGETIFVGPTDC